MHRLLKLALETLALAALIGVSELDIISSIKNLKTQVYIYFMLQIQWRADFSEWEFSPGGCHSCPRSTRCARTATRQTGGRNTRVRWGRTTTRRTRNICSASDRWKDTIVLKIVLKAISTRPCRTSARTTIPCSTRWGSRWGSTEIRQTRSSTHWTRGKIREIHHLRCTGF